VKDERTAGDLVAGKDLAQNNVMIARSVNRGDAATELGRGTLQQRQSVGAERNREIVKSVVWLSCKAGGQVGLMLAKDIDREQTAPANGRSCRAALACAKKQHAGLQRHRRQRVDGGTEQLAVPGGGDDGDPGRKRSHHGPEALGIDGLHIHLTTASPKMGGGAAMTLAPASQDRAGHFRNM